MSKTINENRTDWSSYYELSGELRTARLSKIQIDEEINQQTTKNY